MNDSAMNDSVVFLNERAASPARWGTEPSRIGGHVASILTELGVVDSIARRLQVQERLTTQIGVAVRFSGYAPSGASAHLMGGTVHSRECVVAFRSEGRVTAVATVGNDRLNLAAEAER